MRKKSAIDALFPKVRQGVLAAVILNPDRWWSLSEMARYLIVSPSSLQRELKSLNEAGIILRREERHMVFFQPNMACPFLPELRGLMIKTVGLVDILQEAIAPFIKSIDCAFIYGSVARGEMTSESDVDLMVVGKVGLADMAGKLGHAEKKLSRPVNASIFSSEEIAVRNKAKDNFITTVLKNEKIFIVGGTDELEAATGK